MWEKGLAFLFVRVAFRGWNGAGFKSGTHIQALDGEPGTWRAARVELPAYGKLTALRIDPPGATGTTRFRKIRLTDAAGKTVKSWF